MGVGLDVPLLKSTLGVGKLTLVPGFEVNKNGENGRVGLLGLRVEWNGRGGEPLID